MSNPRRSRNIALAFLASGIAVGIFHLAWVEPAELPVLDVLLLLYWPNAVLFGAIVAAMKHPQARTQRSLFRGDGVLARWRIDDATWQKFAALNRQLNEVPGALPDEAANAFDAKGRIPKDSAAGALAKSGGPGAGHDGIEIIAGESAVQVGDRFHSVPMRGTPEVTQATLHAPEDAPPYIELRLYHPGSQVGEAGWDAPRRTVLRVPVAQDAWRDARRITAHYNRDLPGTPDFFHGRGDGSDPEDMSRCVACGYETYKFRSHCPHCGHGLVSRRWSRRYGGAILAFGLFLTVMMGWVLWETLPTLLQPGVDIDGTRYTGTRFQAILILALLGLVTVFGVVSLVYGAWQVRTGGRNLRALRAIVGLALALLIGALTVGALL